MDRWRKDPPPDVIPIIEKRMGRHYKGMAHDDPFKIEIDVRLRGEEQLEVLIHELLHVMYPHLDEQAVLEGGEWIARQMYLFGIRRIQQ